MLPPNPHTPPSPWSSYIQMKDLYSPNVLIREKQCTSSIKHLEGRQKKEKLPDRPSYENCTRKLALLLNRDASSSSPMMVNLTATCTLISCLHMSTLIALSPTKCRHG